MTFIEIIAISALQYVMRGAFEMNGLLWGQRSPAKAIAQIDQKAKEICNLMHLV